MNRQPGYVGTNAFAALDTREKTKKKKKAGEKSKKGKPTANDTPGLASSTLPPIADVNFDDLNWAEEDEDDGFAMAPMADWVQEHQQLKAQAQAAARAEHEEEEPEDDHNDMVDIAAQLGMEVGQDDDTDDDSETQSKPTSRNVSEIVHAGASQRPIEAKIEEKQLSKKELKQKEMEELAAVLGELGIDTENTAGQNEPTEAALKRKKKKERAKQNAQVNGENGNDDSALPGDGGDPDSSMEPVKLVDPAEAKKKLAGKASTGTKKKKAVNPAFARAAAEEAKARAAKEAVQKEKEKKKHYNQERR